jgi:amino acid permease
MARKVRTSESFNGLMESDLNLELESLLNEIRKTYQGYKIKERVTKAARKRRFLITSALIFFVFTGLIMILKFAGLLTFKGL